ncbi:hypothetical protein GmHk_18G051088 [Glycine max]|nr:hypothetical protein GmHk_18G051088 [Glycine max]
MPTLSLVNSPLSLPLSLTHTLNLVSHPQAIVALTVVFLNPKLNNKTTWTALFFEGCLRKLHYELDTKFKAGFVPRSLFEWENVVIWFCSMHNRPHNYLKGIINSAFKGLDNTPQSTSKDAARWIVVKCIRQKGSTECRYYYFNDAIPLEQERLKALHIQWAKFYLKVKNET